MASTVRGSSNHGHTYTCGNTRVHDESLNKSDSTCPLSEPCSLTSLTSLRLSHTLHPLESCGRRSTTSAFPNTPTIVLMLSLA